MRPKDLLALVDHLHPTGADPEEPLRLMEPYRVAARAAFEAGDEDAGHLLTHLVASLHHLAAAHQRLAEV
ncbi:hypothetical protein LCM28_09980 [Salipiger pacificus]|nr:hypothetical protein [Alloyangia pacifica]